VLLERFLVLSIDGHSLIDMLSMGSSGHTPLVRELKCSRVSKAVRRARKGTLLVGPEDLTSIASQGEGKRND